MKFIPSKTYAKRFGKLPAKQQILVHQRLKLWLAEPSHPQLHDHALHGDYVGLNIGGDLRLVYRRVSKAEVLLADIGTHAQLYE